MGRSHSKILSSYFGLSRSDSRDSAGRALFKAKSGSLDSISTALSLQTQQSTTTRSSSVDNIPQTQPSKVANGKKYALLETDTSSIISSDKKGGREIRLTQSLPAAVERHVGETLSSGHEQQSEQQLEPGEHQGESGGEQLESGGQQSESGGEQLESGGQQSESGGEQLESGGQQSESGGEQIEPGRFSDNFMDDSDSRNSSMEKSEGDTSVVMDKERVGKSLLKGSHQPQGSSKSLTDADPTSIRIPGEILHKLSPDEWDAVVSPLVTLACTTIQQSFRSTIQDQLSQEQQQQQQQHRVRESPSGTKHVRINDTLHMREAQTPECSCGSTTSSRVEERHYRRKRRDRNERPNSLPPLYLRNIHETGEDTQDERRTSPEGQPIRRRSRSHEDCFYYRCKEPSLSGREQCDCRRVRRCQCEHPESSHSHGNRRKRTTVARSREVPVDVSLDDNCPGAPQNRVRRRNYHRRAGVCEKCLGTLGEGTRSKSRQKQRHHPDDEEPGVEVDDPSAEYLDLGQLSTLMLLHQAASQLERETQTDPKNSESFSQKKQRKLKNKHKSFNLDGIPPDTLNISMTDWKELLVPVRTRTGRDSPQTDMAVANLDMKHPKMLAPPCESIPKPKKQLYQNHLVSVSDSSLNHHSIGKTDATVTHIHQHLHFHHIIHHSQP